ncbi:hypothetical protein MTR67_041747 [Solanum verrucosum]|uniref:Terpene synthase metal-binding domain-containing protein n=1 Tax=Solanum verrucosum TaxID=315347 RepID=A0AAF0ZQK3_SOLVR|nr:hypothetical protein MTR67_041747 [Solanum verrucosum]
MNATYMKEYKASKLEAYVEARRKITNAWKEINTEFLYSIYIEVPTSVLKLAMKFARLVDIFQGDDFTDSTKFLKDVITMMLVERVNI